MRNYTLKTYIKKNLLYTILSAQEPCNEYNGLTMDIDELTYGEVKRVAKLLGQVSKWEVIKDIFEICFRADNTEWFYNGKVKEFYAARNYIIKEFNRIIKLEQKLLKSIQDVDSMLWQNAGGDRLNKYGGLTALNQLGKLYGIYPLDLMHKKYMDILTLLSLEKEIGEVQKKYNQLKSKQK